MRSKHHRSGIKPFVWMVLGMAFATWSVGYPADASEKVNYRLKWLLNASVVGDVFADKHRYFEKQGLEVTVKEGGPERDAIRELELGRAQFGVASADQVIRALAKGADVVVIAQLFQINPLQWMYRTEAMTITALGDLKGKTLGVTFGGNDETILRTLLAKAGLSDQDVELFSVRYDYAPFLKKKVNFWPVYRNTQAVFLGAKLRKAGEPYAFFNPAEYGIRFVANSVVTTRRMLNNKPDIVRKFTVGLLRGWRAAMDPANRKTVIQTLRMVDKDTDIETLHQQLDITRTLIHPNPKIPIGTIDEQAWRQTEQIMLNQKQVTTPVAVEKVLVQIPAY